MKRYIALFVGLLSLTAVKGYCLTSQLIQPPPSVSVSSVTIAGGLATITISTPTSVGPYSSGYSNYITHVRIEMYATGTLTGGATPVTCTTTNLASLAFKLPTAAATGTTTVVDVPYDSPIQSTAGSLTAISCPATASVIWNVVVNYFQAP